MAFADHFSAHAAGYAESRPGYPAALFDWLATQASPRALAWDAGCGSGQASVGLARHFGQVFASDPSAAQIAQASPHPRVRYAVEPAERSSLPSASADLVTVAQAYHWFDHAAFCAEARRVLRPGAVIAVWSYARSSVSPAVDVLFDDLHDIRLTDDWPPGREHVLSQYRELPFPFERIDTPAFEMCEQWALSQYLAYLRSWSASERHRQRTGADPVEQMAARFIETWEDPSRVREVRWPLTLLAGRA